MKDNEHRSEKQAVLLKKLILSSVFSQAEAERTARWLDSGAATQGACRAAIERGLKRVEEQKQRRRDAKARQDEAHKDDDEGEPVVLPSGRPPLYRGRNSPHV